MNEPIDELLKWLETVIETGKQSEARMSSHGFDSRGINASVVALERVRAQAEYLKKAAAEKAETRTPEEISLRDQFAAREVINDEEGWPHVMCEVLAGPRPAGSWSTNVMEWIVWTARWRAAARYIRADAMIAESKRASRLPGLESPAP
jgi:hypothetical protein